MKLILTANGATTYSNQNPIKNIAVKHAANYQEKNKTGKKSHDSTKNMVVTQQIPNIIQISVQVHY